MQKEIKSFYSTYLKRDMEYCVIGTGGIALLVFPSQNGRYFDYENNGMVQSIQQQIEDNKVQLFLVDSYDAYSFSNRTLHDEERIQNQENYYHYIVDEFIPVLQSQCSNEHLIYTTGCSMGGYHAVNFLLRRPDLFQGCIALSGAYDLRMFFDEINSTLIYDNSCVDYLNGMTIDHPYVDIYRHKTFILCCGRGAYEEDMQKDLRRMQELFANKNIPVIIDFWGFDVKHDWCWWRKQLPYFVNKILK